MPGTSILEEVADTILQANCHVVIVLSTAYLKDALCLYECRLALYAQRMRGEIQHMYKSRYTIRTAAMTDAYGSEVWGKPHALVALKE